MSYQAAQYYKNQGLINLIQQSLVGGESFGQSVGGAVSDKFKAKMTRIKSKFDPLNLARMLTGKWGTILAGRLLGRSQQDIEYYSGVRGRRSGKRGRYDSQMQQGMSGASPIDTSAFYTSISDGKNEKVQVGDSVANVLTKMLNFMKNVHKEEVLAMELNRDLQQKNHAIVTKNKDKNVFEKVTDNEKEESWLSKLLPKLLSALGILGSIYTALKGLLSPFLEFFSKLKFPKFPEFRIPDRDIGIKDMGKFEEERKKLEEERKKLEDTINEEKKRRNALEQKRKRSGKNLEGIEEIAGAAEGGLLGNRSQRLEAEITPEEAAKLKRSRINFNETTKQFEKPLGQTTRRISPSEVAKMLGKEIPLPDLPEAIGKEGKFGKSIKDAMQKLRQSKQDLAMAKGSTVGKAFSKVSGAAVKTLSYVAVLVGIFAMAVEIVGLIMEYFESPEMTLEELEEDVANVVLSAMIEFGATSVIFWGIDAIVSVSTASFIGPFAILAGTIAALVGTAYITVEFGGDLNSKSKEFAKEIIARFVNREKISALKESLFNKPLKTIEDFNEYNKKMSELTGTTFKPVDINSAGAIGMKMSNWQDVLKKITKAGGTNTPEGKRLFDEFQKQWGDAADLDQQSKSLKDAKSSLNDIKPIIIDNSKNVQVGQSGIEPVLFETNVSLRTDDPSMIKAQKLSLRMV